MQPKGTIHKTPKVPSDGVTGADVHVVLDIGVISKIHW